MIGTISAKCPQRWDETAGGLLPYSRFNASMLKWMITVLVIPGISELP